MQLVDRGHGPPIVLIPGIQGRWEWMRPTVEALAGHFRVLTFSLADEPSCGRPVAARGATFDAYVEQVCEALAQAGLERAVICGISYGGLIAAAFATRHPEQVTALVLVSALPPTWRPDERIRRYLRAPRLMAPLFCLGSVRLLPEFVTAAGGRAAGLADALGHAWRALTHPFGPSRMAGRAVGVEQVVLGDPARMSAPVLVVTGDPALERVVPVALTLQYTRMWPGAEVARLERTGHLGSVTTPAAFAALVRQFVSRHGAGAGADGEQS